MSLTDSTACAGIRDVGTGQRHREENPARELTLAEGETIRGELKQLPLQQHADARLFPAAYQFAVDTQRSLYDCLYLALAAAIDGILVTADRKFYAAVAKGRLWAKVLWVEDLPPQHSLPECVQALYPILAHTALLKVGFQATDFPRSLSSGR